MIQQVTTISGMGKQISAASSMQSGRAVVTREPPDSSEAKIAALAAGFPWKVTARCKAWR